MAKLWVARDLGGNRRLSVPNSRSMRILPFQDCQAFGASRSETLHPIAEARPAIDRSIHPSIHPSRQVTWGDSSRNSEWQQAKEDEQTANNKQAKEDEHKERRRFQRNKNVPKRDQYFLSLNFYHCA